MNREGKQQRSAVSRRRAATHLQELAWLEGYPAGERWWTRAGAPVLVDGALVARSRRIAQTLRREHGEALAELTGDAERWWGVVDAALRWCSARLAAPLPSGGASRARRRDDAELAPATGELATTLLALAPARAQRLARELSAQHPAQRAVLAAASVAWALAPAELTQVLPWLAARPALTELPQALVLAQLATLGGGAEEGVDALLAALTLDAPDPQQAEELVNHARSAVQKAGSARRPKARASRGAGATGATGALDRRAPLPGSGARRVQELAPAQSRAQLERWLQDLASLGPAQQRRALELFAAAEPLATLEPWHRWYQDSAPRLARALELAEQELDRRDDRALEKMEAGLAAVRAALPPRLALRDLLEEISRLAAQLAQAAHHAALLRWLRALPAAAAELPRAKMLLHCARIVRAADNSRMFWLWDALAAALEAGASERLLGPWRHALQRQWQSWLEDGLVDELPHRRGVQRLADALVLVAARGELSEDDAATAAVWVAAGHPVLAPERAAALVLAGRGADRPSEPLARASLALALDSPAQTAERCKELQALVASRDRGLEPALAALVTYAAQRNAGWLVCGALDAKQGEALLTAAAALALIPRTRWPALLLDAEAPWRARYPQELAAALARLASVDPDAADTARQRLATDLPEPAALREEIAALRALGTLGALGTKRPLAERQATRLANLEARLAAPKLPSARRLANLAVKLEHSAVAIGVNRLAKGSTDAAIARVVQAFGLGQWPGWPLDRKLLQILLGLMRLSPQDRALAARLLRARQGPPPWDLRDDPANAAFLERARRRGLCVEPWLEDGAVTVSADGQPVTLALSSDPLEIFAMGAHFETCLSPGSCNFFSVVANAADINKRVLYARRGDRVVGRCLLAITDAGALLTFHPYAHDLPDFAALVRDFAVALAGRMRTTLAPSGKVSTILSRDWYDDGARDLSGRFEALRDDSKLDLATVEPAALPARLREVLDHELDDITLPLVLAMPGLHRRPELVQPLAPFILGCEAQHVRLAAAGLAFRAGELSLADRLLGDRSYDVDLDHHVWTPLEVLAQLRPSQFLAKLRQGRAAFDRWWGQSGEHKALEGVALEALHRPKQAAELYRQALQHDEYLRADLGPRLEALEALEAAAADRRRS